LDSISLPCSSIYLRISLVFLFKVLTNNPIISVQAETLACEAPDVFRAVASVSGVVELRPGNDAGLAQCDYDYGNISSPLSVINIHGTLDFLVPWTGK